MATHEHLLEKARIQFPHTNVIVLPDAIECVNGNIHGLLVPLNRSSPVDLLAHIAESGLNIAHGVSWYTVEDPNIIAHIENAVQERSIFVGKLNKRITDEIGATREQFAAQSVLGLSDTVGLYRQEEVVNWSPHKEFKINHIKKSFVLAVQTVSGEKGLQFQHKLQSTIASNNTLNNIGEVDDEYKKLHGSSLFNEIEKLERESKEARFQILCAFASTIGLYFNGITFEMDSDDNTNALASGLLGANVDNGDIKHATTNVVRQDRNGFVYYLGATAINNNNLACKLVLCPQRIELGYTFVPLDSISTVCMPNSNGNIFTYTMNPLLEPHIQDMVDFVCWFMRTQTDDSLLDERSQANYLVRSIAKPFVQTNCASDSSVLRDVDKCKYKDVLACMKVPPVVIASSNQTHTTAHGSKVLPICVRIPDTPHSVIRRIWGKAMQALNPPTSSVNKTDGAAPRHPLQTARHQTMSTESLAQPIATTPTTPTVESDRGYFEQQSVKTVGDEMSFEDFCLAMSNADASRP